MQGFRGGAPRRRGSEQQSASEGKAFPFQIKTQNVKLCLDKNVYLMG